MSLAPDEITLFVSPIRITEQHRCEGVASLPWWCAPLLHRGRCLVCLGVYECSQFGYIKYEVLMRQVPLREFRTRGVKALGPGNGQNLVILSNRQGPAYFLVPVQPGDLEAQGQELLRAQAKANLRAWQIQARELGLDKMSDEDIDAEIQASREERRAISVQQCSLGLSMAVDPNPAVSGRMVSKRVIPML